MKVVFPTCCGVDVHKTFLVATIITTPADSLQPNYQKKRFSTFNSDLNRCADWLLEHNCLDVCMESTGKYWVPVFNILEKRGIRVVIANPKWVKAVKGNKDDTKDSKWIGDLFRIGLVKSSFIPDLNIRILREFTRYRYKLVSMKSSEKNRFQNAFTVCNVALDSVVSDMFGKSATAITDYLTSDESFDAEHCVSLLQRSLKKKAEQVLESIEGFSIADEQKARIKIIREHHDFIEEMIATVDTRVNEMVAKYEGNINLLCTIPGIDRRSAITIISEIGTDMGQFGSSKRLCCWAGLTPGNICRKKEVCADFPCRCIPEACFGTSRSRCGKGQRSSLLQAEIRANCQAQRQKTSNYCHCQNDSDCCLFHVLHRRSVESCGPLQSRYAGMFEGAAACQSN